MNFNEIQPPRSLDELKALVQQFEVFLPEENRKIIWDIIDEIESTGGIQNKEQLQQLMQKLASKIGLNLDNFKNQ